jgi:hypothetical protein
MTGLAGALPSSMNPPGILPMAVRMKATGLRYKWIAGKQSFQLFYQTEFS